MSSRSKRMERATLLRITRALADQAPDHVRHGMSAEVLAERMADDTEAGTLTRDQEELLDGMKRRLKDYAARGDYAFSDDRTAPVFGFGEESLVGWAKAGGKKCRHIGPELQPAVLALWNLVIKCIACSPTNNVEGVEDFTCDRCRSVHLDGLHPVAMQYGFVLIQAGLCDACCADLSITFAAAVP